MSNPISNGNLTPNHAADSSDESVNADTSCLRKTSQHSRMSDHGRSEDKPSFSSIVDRRDRKGLIPLFFERASGNVFNPCFDSETLELEFQRFSVNVDKSRFQIALLYIAFASITLSIFFGVSHKNTDSHVMISVGSACAGVVSLIVFVVTKSVKLYSKPNEARVLSISVSILYAVVEVVFFFVVDQEDFTYAARFCLATCLIIVIYTMMPALPLYGSLILALMFSIAYEVVSSIKADPNREVSGISSIILLHFCIHILGITIVFMAQVRRRSTFWRVGQSVVAKQDLDIEQRVKNRMIRSVMPKKVAEFLIMNGLKQKRDGTTRQKKVAFRPFTMYKMQNVSILFADIVGFTNMSAKKEADHLVHLLNMLFGKFDELTEINNCEKISTLGDCYYCVAGCPEYSKYHGISCVEMGLDIVEEIKKFCHDTGENVDMRVGIHTGNVLCGILGDRRRRFDVWSNDVTLANKMESAGKPGRVHFTEVTLEYLNDQYLVEKGEGIMRPENDGGGVINSYFITSRKNGLSAYKPWQKEGDNTSKQSITSLHEAVMTHSDSIANVLVGLSPDTKRKFTAAAKCTIDPKDVHFGALSPSHKKTNSMQSMSECDSIEKDFLSSRSPTLSPAHGNLQKHLAKTPLPYPRLSATFNFTYGMTLNEALMRDAMRASNDNQLVRLMHEKKIQKEYFFNPPLHLISLNFTDEEKKDEKKKHRDEMEMEGSYGEQTKKKLPVIPTEKKYRDEGFKGFKLNPKVTTFASPKVHFLFDVVTCSVTLTIMIIATVLVFYNDFPVSLMVVIPICILGMLTMLLIQCVKFSPSKFPRKLSRCAGPLDKENSETGSTDNPSSVEMHDVRNHNRKGSDDSTNDCQKSIKKALLSPWIIAHIIGGLIMCFPIIVVFATYQSCGDGSWVQTKTEYYSMLMFVALLHFCSFTQLSSLMKTGIAFAWCIAFIFILCLADCIKEHPGMNEMVTRDIVMTAVLLIILITVLNRIHEQGVRANFYGDKEAAEQKNIAIEQKQVADWLIQDMFPRHVSEQLKYTNHCSKNYDMVGVLFSTIVNFSEFYEENFEGGIECIRILHELVADFDKELTKYKDVEKIKTVYGTTFMAASGLNPIDEGDSKKKHKYMHLKTLMDFALGLQRTLNEFNQNMLGFRYRMRFGLNAGPVTAGVIGTMKPQYDIWGDTVNLASRMDTTGVQDKIQVEEECMKKLTDFYTFEWRGTILVKGKGDVSTFLLIDRRHDAPDYETVDE